MCWGIILLSLLELSAALQVVSGKYHGQSLRATHSATHPIGLLQEGASLAVKGHTLAGTPVIDPLVASVRCLLPPLLRIAKPLGHLLVLRSDRRPTHRGSVPTIIVDGH